MRSSIPLFDSLAAGYDAHFSEVPHRRAYDDLAWEFVQPLLPAVPGYVIDAGCGVGRWAERLVVLGHSVVGIEQAPAMSEAVRARLPTDRFKLIEGSMEEVDDELCQQADLVLALGSLQYTVDPEHMIERFARWVRVGGSVVVLVDSLVALLLELVASGKTDEALQRLKTRRGIWVQGKQYADNHQLDRDRLVDAFHRAGLNSVCARGLLVSASAIGGQRLIENLTKDWDAQISLERQFAEKPLLADLGKQLFISGQRAE
jgi:SAM-dependent methyltransferase